MSNYDVMTRAARYPPDEEADYPIWYDGKKINEVLFCEEFLQDHPMLCVRDVFCTTEGRVTDETMLKRRILERIKPYITSGVAKRAANLLDALRVGVGQAVATCRWSAGAHPCRSTRTGYTLPTERCSSTADFMKKRISVSTVCPCAISRMPLRLRRG